MERNVVSNALERMWSNKETEGHELGGMLYKIRSQRLVAT
jgi:hypothetical protein